ncbi:Hint domain-containing protein [Actibacterium sp. D379-3]
MAWIALTDTGFGQRPDAASGPPLRVSYDRDAAEDDILETGSLYLEAEIGRGTARDHPLFVLHRRADITSHISVQLCKDGTIVFARKLGRQSRQVTLRPDRRHTEGTIRLTISWNAAARRGLLSAEFVTDGTLLQKEFADPLPWLNSDIARLRHPGREVIFGPALRCFGLSDRLEPVGITPSFAAGTPVLTPDGYRRVESLRPGDAVLTDTGAARQIRWTCTREVPARGRFRPIRLYAPYLGLVQDVVVAPEQRLVVDGPEVEYLFSEEAVLVEAHALLHTNFAASEPAGPTIRYHQVLLDDPAMLRVAGAAMESLFVGSLRDAPDMLATTVLRNAPPGHLPMHKQLAYPALRNYEAVTLRAALLSR